MSPYRTGGLTLVEVIVAMFILTILGAALVAVVPGLTRSTRASSEDSVLTQAVYSAFEVIGASWTNPTAFDSEEVDVAGGRVLLASADGAPGYVAQVTEDLCEAVVTPLSDLSGGATRKRVVVTCDPGEGVPAWTLRAEYGDPGE